MTPKSRTLAILMFATLSGMSMWFMTAAVLPDMAREAGLPEAALARLSSAVQAGFVIGALGSAITGLADRIDPRKLFASCAVLTAMATLLLLVLPVGGAAMVAARFAAGMLMAGVYPVGMKLAVGWGTRDRGLLVGLLIAALTFGKSLPYFLAWAGGADWRLALATGACIAAVGGLAVLLTELGPHHARATAFTPRAIALAWTDRRIRAAYSGYLGHMWELYVVWSWLAVAATASFAARMEAEEAASLAKLTTFLAIAAGAPLCVLAGRFGDRVGKGRISAAILATSGCAAIASAFAFGGPLWLVVPLFVFWGAMTVPDSGQFSAMVADHAPPDLAGSLLSLQTALGFGLTVITVAAAPHVADALGWPALFAILALGPALGIWGLRPVMGRPGP